VQRIFSEAFALVHREDHHGVHVGLLKRGRCVCADEETIARDPVLGPQAAV
jgi:hypothetical protein